MKKLTLFLLLLITAQLFSQKVSEKQARIVAKHWFWENGGDTLRCELIKGKYDTSTHFAYNFGNKVDGGAVIIRREFKVAPVLYYDLHFKLKFDGNGNNAIYSMLAIDNEIVRVARTINAPKNTDWARLLKGSPKRVKAGTKIVPPLVNIYLNQDNNFWDSMGVCKIHNLQIYTGCGPCTGTGIAAYWKYPATGTGSFSYTDPVGGVRSCDFSKVKYDWSNIPSTFTKPNPTICKFQRDLGIAEEAQLGCIYEGGTGIFVLGMNERTAQYALINNFNFKSTMRGAYQATNPAAFDSTMRADLDAGRPVEIFGYDPAAGGHTWICDGYDANGMFHMLLGWGTSGVGYYRLNALNVSGYAFNSGVGALFGIEPNSSTPLPTPCAAPIPQAATSITTSSATLSWTGSNASYILTINGQTIPLSGNSYSVTGLLNNTSYSWGIVGVCADGSKSGQATSSFTTLPLPCVKPTILSISNVTSTSVKLAWVESSSVTSRTIHYSVNKTDGSSSSEKTITATVSPFVLTGLLPATKYLWYVQVKCGTTTVNSSYGTGFTTLAADTIPVPPPTPIDTPKPCVANTLQFVPTSRTCTANWIALPNDSIYSPEYRINGATTWTPTQTMTGTTIKITGLIDNSNYEFRLPKVCKAKNSYVSTGSFVTITCQ